MNDKHAVHALANLTPNIIYAIIVRYIRPTTGAAELFSTAILCRRYTILPAWCTAIPELVSQPFLANQVSPNTTSYVYIWPTRLRHIVHACGEGRRLHGPCICHGSGVLLFITLCHSCDF
jgi:hypothetical protein